MHALVRIYSRLAPNLLLIFEAVQVIAVVAWIFLSQQRLANSAEPRSFRAFSRAFSNLARRKVLCVVLTGASVLAIRVALIPLLGVPEPMWHDEYSFLLAADTFAHGRLTNPTHPMWKHFESFHIIQQPTYMSMYPPAQGLILAAGQLLGHPWIGQLVVTALMCSALCWMLQAWLPPAWALFGAALAVLRLGILFYWMNSYFAGSLTALAGALVLGSLPRIQRHRRLRDAAVMGIGLATLANTRPYEGLVFSLPIAMAMSVWLARQKQIPTLTVMRRVVLPLILILGVTGAAMGYYFWRVTGDPLLMPYQVDRQTYAMAPYFIWQHVATGALLSPRGNARFLSGMGVPRLFVWHNPARFRAPFALQTLCAVEVLCRSGPYNSPAGVSVHLPRPQNEVSPGRRRLCRRGNSAGSLDGHTLRGGGHWTFSFAPRAVHAAFARVAMVRKTGGRRAAASGARDLRGHDLSASLRSGSSRTD